MGMEDLLADLKKSYLKELPEKVDALRDLFNRAKWPELQDGFHKLKGSGKTYGVEEVSTICGHLEAICKNEANELPPVFEDCMLLLLDVGKAHQEGGHLELSVDDRFKKLEKVNSR